MQTGSDRIIWSWEDQEVRVGYDRLGVGPVVLLLPARFVTGMLDPMLNHSLFVEAARRVKEPILVVYGAATPKRSKAEMETLASVPHVRSVVLSHGKLAVHEEFPDAVAEAVRSFLRWDAVGKSAH